MTRPTIDNGDTFGRLFVLGGFSLVPRASSSVTQRDEVNASTRDRRTVTRFMIVRELGDEPVGDNEIAR
jgi:hypothetical protein